MTLANAFMLISLAPSMDNKTSLVVLAMFYKLGKILAKFGCGNFDPTTC